MGAGPSASNDGGSDAGFSDAPTPSKLSKKNQELVDSSFKDRGAIKIKNQKIISPVLNILKGPLKAGSKVTRNFFTDKVLTSKRGMKNLGTTKEKFLNMSISQQESIYGDYMGGRQSGKTDAYGNTTNNQDGNNTPTVIKKNIGGKTIQTTAPTEAEVSQSETANADAAALKVKKRGRSMTMMSGAKGVTRTSSDYSLGKKSLLGIV